MKITLRRTVLITGLLLIAAPSRALESCNPPAQPKIDWTGTQTGCRPSPNPSVIGAPCAVGEVINFKAVPVTGSFQSCDGFFWGFNDPADGSASVQNPSYAFSSPGNFDIELGVFNQVGSTSASKIIALTVQPFASEFIATPSRAAVGNDVTLSWKTTSVTKVHIDPLNLDFFPPNNSYKFKPAKTTVYTLVPFNGADQGVAHMVTVEVFVPRRRSARH
jgi:PKD repeat protein